jgi:hypothetical protein
LSSWRSVVSFLVRFFLSSVIRMLSLEKLYQ